MFIKVGGTISGLIILLMFSWGPIVNLWREKKKSYNYRILAGVWLVVILLIVNIWYKISWR